MATMKAVRIHDFGGPEVLRIDDTAVPTPADNELLVRVCAAGVNPVDYKTRGGHYAPVNHQNLPATLGRDVSGMVERVGNAARGFQERQPAFAMLGPDRGTFAEYVVVKAAEAAPKPRCLSHTEAAAVPLAALTAWQGLFDHGQLAGRQRVLIHGGAGGVGHFAIQFAKRRGAIVMTTVSADDRDFARDLGADIVIDYQAERFEDLVRDVDLVFDLIGGETQERSWSVLKQGGTLVSTLGEPPRNKARAYQVHGVGYMAEPNGRQLGEIARMIDAEKITPIVSAAYPWRKVGDAQQRQRKGRLHGKIVLELAA
jgi:NADPH:quinone reductase-like Zn-dependent oxidoreductase